MRTPLDGALTLRKSLLAPKRRGRYNGDMLFVVHALDKKDMLPVRAKHYRAHRIHLDRADDHAVDVVTAGTLVADDGETPIGSIFVIDAKDRAAVDAFTRTDPYHVNGVWGDVAIHRYNRKRGTPIVSRR